MINFCRHATAYTYTQDLSVLACECGIACLALACIGTISLVAKVDARATFTAIMPCAIVFAACLSMLAVGQLVTLMALTRVSTLAISADPVEATWVASAIIDVHTVRWLRVDELSTGCASLFEVLDSCGQAISREARLAFIRC
jgi:hypothetical protein